ncbi:MAG: aminodeoxychorismate synthase component I [Neisseriaceae bacterium]|nr:aminodeoxychorismate synthase component I [Neisseriaceae bacterium]
MNKKQILPFSKQTLKSNINHYAAKRAPFFFMVNFAQDEGYFLTQENFHASELLFNFPYFCNAQNDVNLTKQNKKLQLEIQKVIDYKTYAHQFETIQQELYNGHTFLINLTQSTLIKSELDLIEIFYLAQAKYKVLLNNQFICFSPETFIRINQEGKISTYPMKGTINADLPNAQQILKEDNKEIAEHKTIVDLMRNDLNLVATQTKVDRFRYFELINTAQRNIYQTSSEISGQLPYDYLNYLGDIIFELLPAGSISGAPKSSTINIIKQVETHDRGYYTGVAGYFDGYSLDTCVLIRFIEQQAKQLVYKSGGGITAYSDIKKEYQELVEKIYLPFVSE